MSADASPADPHRVRDIATLAALYGEPNETSIRKEVGSLHPVYRALVEAAPFAVLATSGPDGLDASPRGDAPGFVVVQDEHTLLLPDRRGNNRKIDTVFFQCSRALVRSRLWDAASQPPRASLPSAGAMLSALTQAQIDGVAYDRELPERVKTSLY